MMHDMVFLFDVDNTLLDNDRVQADLHVHIGIEHGVAARTRYWEIFAVFAQQGRYAADPEILARYPHGDFQIAHIGDLVNYSPVDLSKRGG